MVCSVGCLFGWWLVEFESGFVHYGNEISLFSGFDKLMGIGYCDCESALTRKLWVVEFTAFNDILIGNRLLRAIQMARIQSVENFN